MGLAQAIGLTLVAAAVVLITIILIRRAVLVRAGGFDVSWRLHPGDDDRGWILGQARFHGGKLALYRSFSAWPTPSIVMGRAALGLGAIRAPMGAEPDLLPDGVAIVAGSWEQTPLELALAEDALTALRSWVESRPPGSRLPNRGPLGEDSAPG